MLVGKAAWFSESYMPNGKFRRLKRGLRKVMFCVGMKDTWTPVSIQIGYDHLPYPGLIEDAFATAFQKSI